MALVGHCISQAMHIMHAGSLTGSDFLSESVLPGVSVQSKTETGQTDIQIPSALQQSKSTATFVP
jgi:hypothetical protein